MITSSSNGAGGDAYHADEPCPHCGGVGFVVPDVLPDDPRFGRAQPCVCKQAELEARRSQRLVQMSQLGALGNCKFDTFIPDGIGLAADRARTLRLAYEKARAFARKPDGWLLLKGGYGCGKTHLAAAIANAQLEAGRPVLFVSTPDLLDHLRSTYRPGSDVSYDERFEQVRNTPLLIIDDLGAHNASDWAQEKLYQIFNYRYNAKLPTVVTTNEELDAIEVRVRSRLSDLSLVQFIPILAPDFRRGGVHQEDADLSSLHLHADKTFESFELRTHELTAGEVTNLRNAFDALRQYAEAPRDWYVINGTHYGNGKTHLAAAAANAIAGRGERVLFIVVPDLLDHLRASFNPASGARLDKRFNEVKNAPFLVLDDLGTESATAWAREKMHQLFNHRYSARLPTIITTATPIDQIDPKLAARFFDGNRCTIVLLNAPPYRGAARPKRVRGARSRGE